MGKLREIRCPFCHRLLFKAIGGADHVEILCPRCKHLLIWGAVCAPAETQSLEKGNILPTANNTNWEIAK